MENPDSQDGDLTDFNKVFNNKRMNCTVWDKRLHL